MPHESLGLWQRQRLIEAREVLRLLDGGMEAEQIAEQMELGVPVVKRHIIAANRMLQRDMEQDVARLQAHKMAVLDHHLSELEYAFSECLRLEDYQNVAQLSKQMLGTLELKAKIDGSMAAQKIDVEVRILSLAVQMGISDEEAQLALNEVKLIMAQQKQRR